MDHSEQNFQNNNVEDEDEQEKNRKPQHSEAVRNFINRANDDANDYPQMQEKMVHVKRVANTVRSLPDRICDNKYAVLKEHRLGSGTYGDALIVSSDNSLKFAAKFEKIRINRRAVLYYDQQFLYYLSDKCKSRYVPKFIAYGTTKHYVFLVMELLGPSISEIFKHSMPEGLSLKTCTYLSVGMFKCILALHTKEVIHRDVKPDNFAFGSMLCPTRVFIFDFGLSKQYRANGLHIPMRSGKVLTGTARYVSISTHRGLEQSRRDDLESIGYVMVFLYRKSYLPWMGLKNLPRAKHFREIARIKIEIPMDELIGDIPPQIGAFITYARKLPFEMDPNYQYLFELLCSISETHGISLDDNGFDWETNPKLFKAIDNSLYRISPEFNSTTFEQRMRLVEIIERNRALK